MPKFQVTVADETGHKLYDETIEAPGPNVACEIAARESQGVDTHVHTLDPIVLGAYTPGAGAHPFWFSDGGLLGSKMDRSGRLL